MLTTRDIVRLCDSFSRIRDT